MISRDRARIAYFVILSFALVAAANYYFDLGWFGSNERAVFGVALFAAVLTGMAWSQHFEKS